MKRRTGRNQGIYVQNRTVLPKKRASVVVESTARKRRADDLSFRINGRRKAARILIYRPEISHLANASPEGRVKQALIGKRSRPCDLSRLVDSFGPCLVAANCAAQVFN